jgi:hypothetical protein
MTRAKSRVPKANAATSGVARPEITRPNLSLAEFVATVCELVDLGYVDVAGEPGRIGESVLVPVPDELLAPRDVPTEVQQHEDAALIECDELPDRLRKLLARQAAAALTFLKSKDSQIACDSGTAFDLVVAGFDFAVARYADRLRHMPELQEWEAKRFTGGQRGRLTQSQQREDRYRRIRETWADLESAGQQPTNASVAAAAKCSVSTVIRAFKDEP